jgi:hypothetical protein
MGSITSHFLEIQVRALENRPLGQALGETPARPRALLLFASTIQDRQPLLSSERYRGVESGDRVGQESRQQPIALPAIIDLGAWRQSSFVP